MAREIKRVDAMCAATLAAYERVLEARSLPIGRL